MTKPLPPDRPRRRLDGPLADRFPRFVPAGAPDECWEWRGNRGKNGYGVISVDNRHVYAHRIAYEFTHGPIGVGMVVMHSCDNRPCVNPAHLSLGTVKDNNDDARRKGRMPPGPPRRDHRGSLNPQSKLTEAQVAEIRRRGATGESRPAIARDYGISASAVYGILRGHSWKNVA